jgi:hypothetical protein
MKKSKFFIIVIILMLILTGCSTTTLQGFITQKEIEERANNKKAYRVLVIQRVTKEDIKNNTPEKLLDMARENNLPRIWFWVTENEFNELEVGQKVRVYVEKKSNMQLSDPPLSGQTKIKILD